MTNIAASWRVRKKSAPQSIPWIIIFLPYVPQKNCNFSQVTLRLRPRSGARGCVLQLYLHQSLRLNGYGANVYVQRYATIHMCIHSRTYDTSYACVCVWVERLNRRYTSILFLSSAGGGSRVQSLPPTKTPWFPWWYKEPACRLSYLDEFNFCTVFAIWSWSIIFLIWILFGSSFEHFSTTFNYMGMNDYWTPLVRASGTRRSLFLTLFPGLPQGGLPLIHIRDSVPIGSLYGSISNLVCVHKAAYVHIQSYLIHSLLEILGILLYCIYIA